MQQINRDSISKFFSGSGKGIYEICEQTVKKFEMDSHIRSGVLVGFSGGADSMLLLCFLLEYRKRQELDFTILPVHINHGIRGEEAKRDENFCVNVCSLLDLTLAVRSFSVPSIAEDEHLGIEEAARNVRYSAFEEIKQSRNDIDAIAVAHNMTDNAETVILNILRGSGTRGGAGIRPVRDNIIRPLIAISKSDIIEAMDSFGIPYVVDSTNLSTDYTRNYVRSEILPRLDRVSDNSVQMISRFAENLRSDNEFIEITARKLISEDNSALSADLIESHYSVYVRALSQMAEMAGCRVSSKIAADIYNLLPKNNFSYSIIGGTFICERGVCKIQKVRMDNEEFCYYLTEGKNSPNELYDIIVSKEKNIFSTSNIYKKTMQVNLSSAMIEGDLYIRPKKDGDTIQYGGMTHKLKKLFNDRKIPLSERKKLPIFCDGKGVVWVPGYGVRDDAVPVEKRTDLFVLLGYLSERGD